MSKQLLSSYFTLNRRYFRSINLERDAADAANLTGYVITERAEQSLKRILEGAAGLHTASAWMLTGVYGTGKSAFGHFLCALFASQKTAARKHAEALLKQNRIEQQTRKLISAALPERGWVRAAATAQREPVSHTVVRALLAGVRDFWGAKTKVGADLTQRLEALHKLQGKGKTVETGVILQLVREISESSGTGVLLLLDELGKSLEFAAQNRSAGDLYLLQQIAELGAGTGPRVFLIGLLHQAFSEYSYGLGTIERNEWTKIQGRFEELPFTESPAQMTQLIGQVIEQDNNPKLNRELSKQAEAWHAKLSKAIGLSEITAQLLNTVAPLHPVAALVLPQLCIRYAQNDRSLFTFLTSTEPHSLRSYLSETCLCETQVSLLQLDRLYDYFIDSVGIGAVSRLNFQRWTEVKSLIEGQRNSEPEELRLLKTIGLLNLASTAGFLKASRQLVILALCNTPDDRAEQNRWGRMINALIERGLVIHRRQIDELRIWEGSDFNLEAALTEAREQIQAPLAALLSEACPLRPVVIQRHSYETGTLRFFERRYLDSQPELAELQCATPNSDGLAAYWVDETPPLFVPALTAEQKPLVLIQVGQNETLRLRVLELIALKKIQATAAELQSDGIARRELRYRLTQARQLLDETFAQVIESQVSANCWLDGRAQTLNLKKELNARLSALCDAVYARGLKLWNELINRQELTSQGAKARGQVIAAMLDHPEAEKLGLTGDGPEVSVYLATLQRTGIHREVDGEYGFHAPTDTKVKLVWEAIESFCLSAKDKPLSLDLLYGQLQQPPYGVKSGVIPILLASVVLKHSDDVSIYREGTFIPVLGPEHFELLVKYPARFSVKHYEILGLRAQVFRELEDILTNRVGIPSSVRNRTLLNVVSPLLQFARRLPQYTQKTRKLSAEVQAVRQVLLEANEPDKLLFELLPVACGLDPIAESGVSDPRVPKELRARLISALKELREAHEILLKQCREYVREVFGIRQDVERLREDLRARASYLHGRSIEPILTRFVFAATEDLSDDKTWLEGLVMVIADKPSESWTDTDADAFELKLSDLARRFKNLEAIIHDNRAASGGQAEARRITITRPDGTELHDVAWVEETDRAPLNDLANEILKQHNLDSSRQRALLAVLTEKILGAAQPGMVATFKAQSKSAQGEQEDEAYPRIVRR